MAEPADTSLAQMHHTAWGANEGAPPNIYALAQGSDGFLWLGALTGLFRFDGVRFSAYSFADGQRLPSLSVSALLVDSSQRLWIGSGFGGVSMLGSDGRLRHYGKGQGLPRGSVRCLLQDLDGTIWACTTDGIAWFDGARWRALEAMRGIDAEMLSMDTNGAIWVSSSDVVNVVERGTRRVRRLDLGAFAKGGIVTAAPDGRIWLASPAGAFQIHGLPPDGLPRVTKFAEHGYGDALFFDRHGGMWFEAGDLRLGPGGIGYLPGTGTLQPKAAVPEFFTQQQGLSGAMPLFQLEDREGNIWVSTTGGLDRFRANRLHQFPYPVHRKVMLHIAADGALWFGSKLVPMHRLGTTLRTIPAVGPSPTAILDLGDEAALIATETGLWRVQKNRTTLLPTPVPVNVGSSVQAMLYDRRGNLWLSQTRTGLFRLIGEHWRADPVPGLFKGPAISMHMDNEQRIWLGYPENHLSVVTQAGAQETARTFSAADGLDVGNVLSMGHDAGHLWIGGDRGLAEFDGRHFHRLAGKRGEPFGGASGIALSSDGALWINGADGITRISAEELRNAREAPQAGVAYQRFDHLDGLSSRAPQMRPVPSLERDAEGRLWFTTENGIVWIDPLAIPTNPLPPPVQVLGIRSNEHDYPALGTPALPARTTDLEIAFTALSLSIPERVRFRYRLDGVDTEWRDVGTRRTAYYNNLGPGDYRFRVIACNNDGVWNETGATQAFSIVPAYYQTLWFRIAGALLACLALWLLYRRRVHVLAMRHRARLDERERIARELHDTLLQSTQGLIVHFQAVADRMDTHNAAHASMNRVLDQADSVLAEGRDRVLQLRQSGAADLAASLTLAAGILGEHNGAAWRVRVTGAVHQIKQGAAGELMRVAHEALSNAFHHAAAANIDIVLTYAPGGVSLCVSDDGQGIAPDVLRQGVRPGHWGLPGMRERAKELGARLQIDSSPHGTVVNLFLPARQAYGRNIAALLALRSVLQRARTMPAVLRKYLAGLASALRNMLAP